MESSLECGVCFVEYNSKEQRPKSLPCGHSICSSCITDSLRAMGGKMNCPFCRASCGIGDKSVDDFPTTFALLNLLEDAKQKSISKSLSPREIENETLQQKKQSEYDRTGEYILDCNEHLVKICNAKETKESAIHNIRIEKKKLLEGLKVLEEKEKTATSVIQLLGDIAAEGNDIVKGLQALQDRVKSTSSLLGINMASQDVQKYHTASQEWITSRVKDMITDNTQVKTEENIKPDTNVSQSIECRREFSGGAYFYSCLECRKDESIVMCGSCFVNSTHLNHRSEIQPSPTGGICDCGIQELWKRDSNCTKHLKKSVSTMQAFNKEQQKSSKCKEVFYKGEKCYTCLDCHHSLSDVICGSCFLNSSHRYHRYAIETATCDGAFCDCGNRNVWKNHDTCNLHK